MSSNGTYVCVTCKTSKRRDMPYSESDLPKCDQCREAMEYLGKHWRIPKRSDERGWKSLRLDLAKKKYRLSGL